MQRLPIVLAYSCTWTLHNKIFPASSVSSWNCEGKLGIVQDWLILCGHLFIQTCTVRMRSVYHCYCPNFPGAFTTVVPYTTQTMILYSGLMSHYTAGVCTLSWGVPMTIWKTFIVMMWLLVLNKAMFTCVAHLHSKASFSFFHVTEGQFGKVLLAAPFLVMCVSLARLLKLFVIFVFLRSILCNTYSASSVVVLVSF